jgi:hypothetical protein
LKNINEVLRYLNFGLTINLDHATTLILNVSNRPISRQSELDLAVNIALTRELALSREQRQSLTKARINALALARTLIRELNLAHDRALASEHAKARRRDISVAKAIAHHRDIDSFYDTELDLQPIIKALTPSFKKIDSASTDDQPLDTLEAQQLIELKISEIESTTSKIRLMALKELLSAAQAKEILESRSAHRMFLIHTLESAYLNLKKIESEGLRSKWDKDDIRRLDSWYMNISKTYWWLRIVIERESDSFPAWESIRIVREQGRKI